MAVIHIFTLSSEVARGIEERRYSEGQIAEIYESYKKDEHSKKKGFWIAMILVAALFLGYGIPVVVKSIGLPEAFPLIVSIFVFIGIVWVLTWYFTIGAIKLKWNRLIKEYYPVIYEKYRL